MSSQASQGDSFFLSYSRSDERVALRLAKDLRERGIAMWVDQLDIRPSEHWDRAIEQAVASCRGIVVILSPRSIASDNVMDEISYAIDSGKSVLPVMIEKCTLPLRLTRKQVIDAAGNYDRALQQCHDELARRSQPEATGHASEPPRIDSAEVAKAKQQLAKILGPIAGRIVDKAAARAKSTAELYGIVGHHIDDPSERTRFVALASARSTEPAQPHSVDAASIECLTRLLARYIGPIAEIVVKRESDGAIDEEQLCKRLADRIPDERQKAEFLREARGR